MAGGAREGARGRWALSPRVARLRTHPVVIGALAVLIVNDHLLKERWPGPVTGIASDVAGLVLLPVAIVLVLDAVRAQPVDRRTVVATSAVVAFGFAAVELLPAADAAYEVGLGLVGWPARTLFGGDGGWRVVATPDPGDLLALPFAATGAWLWSRTEEAAVRARPIAGAAHASPRSSCSPSPRPCSPPRPSPHRAPPDGWSSRPFGSMASVRAPATSSTSPLEGPTRSRCPPMPGATSRATDPTSSSRPR